MFKEDGQGEFLTIVQQCHYFQSGIVSDVHWKFIQNSWMSEKYKSYCVKGILIGFVFEF